MSDFASQTPEPVPPDERTTSGSGRWNAFAPALRSRNFRLFWFAQIISTIGTSLQVISEGYLIYDITDSTFWLGAVGFISLLPVLPISLAGGILIDRLPRRKLIMITQFGLFVQAMLFAILALTGRVALWNVILLYFVFGALMAIDHPARRAFLVDIVNREDLANAVALNATVFNVSSLIGFAAGGVLIATIGVGGTMFINALTYLAPILALAAMRIVDVIQDTKETKFSAAISEGFTTLLKQPVILSVIAIMAVVGGLAYPVFGLMPAYAEEIMQVDAVGLGLLLAAGAFGSVLGTFGATRLGGEHRGRHLILSGLALSILVILFAHAPNMWAACFILIFLGFMLLVVQSLAITVVQLHTPDRVRGRVMSIYSILHAGADSGGNLVIGALAVPIGLVAALTAAGAAAFSFAFGLNLIYPKIRRLE
ncbi:MAG: MFS transporter [Candidatus Promineifilaceae bacterium]|nr:MFS transporter [Candidatus Promineifilaceae bacterium]